MDYLTAPLSSLSLLAVMYTFYILANLSRRYGEVIKMPPYYRGLYAAMGLTAVSFVSHLIRDSVIVAPDRAPALLNEDWFYLCAYHLPLAVAVVLGIGIAWRYWSWILKEQQE